MRSVGAASRYQLSDGEEDEDTEMGDSPACEVRDMVNALCQHINLLLNDWCVSSSIRQLLMSL